MVIIMTIIERMYINDGFRTYTDNELVSQYLFNSIFSDLSKEEQIKLKTVLDKITDL